VLQPNKKKEKKEKEKEKENVIGLFECQEGALRSYMSNSLNMIATSK